MTTLQTGEQYPKRLRVWPAIVLVAIQWFFRYGVKELVPGITGFGYAVMGSLACTLALIIWWAFFSRARRVERFGGLGIIVAIVGASWLLKHESMWLPWLLAYAIPVICLAFVLWAVATRWIPGQYRFATMVAVMVVACGGWLLFRQDGINGDHVATFGWRWSKSAEERLLTETSAQPAAVTPANIVPAASPSPTPSTTETPKAVASTNTVVVPQWPGFRGPGRDGVVTGVKIKTDWSSTPPKQLWRHAVGPGWSSFAVQGDLMYTQEQRGENEVVACYKACTGQLVWSHNDSARFFESNAGAGPRGTPTLSNGRVYTFGATGILNVLDATNGSVIWTRNVATEIGKEVPFWGFSSSPLVLGDAVIIAASGQLVAYDVSNGKQRWIGPSAGGSYSSPHLVTLGGAQQILLMSGSGVSSFSITNGEKLWNHEWPGNSIVQPALTPEGDVLLTSQENGTRKISVNYSGGSWSVQERWTSNGLKPYFNDFVIHKGYAFGFDGRILSCIDLKDGQRKWKGGRYGNGQLVLLTDQDLLLVLSEEGEIAMVGATPDQFNERGKISAITGKTWNHPVLVGDLLLVRNSEEMAAFRLGVE